MTAVPMICRPTAPAPDAIASGRTPRMNANAVIKIGRRRRRAAASAASISDLPPSYSAFANSTIRIAFLADEPDEHDQADLGIHVMANARSHSAVKAPKTAIGTVRSTLNGNDQLSYGRRGSGRRTAARSRKWRWRARPVRRLLPGTTCRSNRNPFPRHGLGKRFFQGLPSPGRAVPGRQMPLICAAL